MACPQHTLAAPCSAQHTFHLYCFQEWCKAQGPDRANCPSCRRPLFTNPSIVDYLKYNVIGNVFVPNSRYTSWENFERSCADLDKELAENDQSLIICAGKLTLDAFIHFKYSDALQPDASRFRVDYNKFPESSMVEEALIQAARGLNGRKMPVKVMYRTLMTAIHSKFTSKYFEKGLHYAMPTEDLAAYVSGDTKIVREMMLPGFYAYLERLLNRVVRFQLLRACRCPFDETEHSEEGVHFHGDGVRGYYTSEGYGLPPAYELSESGSGSHRLSAGVPARR